MWDREDYIKSADKGSAVVLLDREDSIKSADKGSAVVVWDREDYNKSANKGSAVVVWDREDHIKEAEKQLGDEEVYEEVSNDVPPLLETITAVIAKIRKRGDLKRDNLDYFIMKDTKFARFYLLPKIHKRLHNGPGRPVISNSGYYTENISSFLNHHLQPLAQAVKSYIKDRNEFLKCGCCRIISKHTSWGGSVCIK